MTWDLRTEGVRIVPGLLYDGPTSGWVVPPGRYTVRLIAGADTSARPLEVRDAPHAVAAASEAARAAAHARRAEVNRLATARVEEVTSAVLDLRALRDEVGRLAERAKAAAPAAPAAGAPGDGAAGPAAGASDGAPARIAARAAAVRARLDTLEGALVQVRRKTFQDVVNYPPALLDHYLFVARQADEAEPATRGVTDRLADLDAAWGRHRAALADVVARDVAELNRLAREGGVPAVAEPARRRAGAAGAVSTR
jgi:hypothetical protein